LALLGATARQSTTFLGIEGALNFELEALLGIMTGTSNAAMLVALLQGVFDLPPQALNVPWAYLAAISVLGLISILAAVETARRDAEKNPLLTIYETR
jgi:putative ABC transport system permease protein